MGREGGDEEAAASDLGFPAFATKNTTRVGSADAVATRPPRRRPCIPSRDEDTRPSAVTLVDSTDWRVAVSAAQLMAAPLRAPVLYTRRRRAAAGDRAGARAARPDRRRAGRRRAGDPRRPGGRARGLQDDDRRRRRLRRAGAGDRPAPDRGGRQAVARPSSWRPPSSRASRCRPRRGRPSRATPCCGSRATRSRRPRAPPSPRTSARRSTSSARSPRSRRACSSSSASSARRAAWAATTRWRTRSPSRASRTGASAGTSSTPATGSCSRAPSGRSTRRPRRRSRHRGPTARCCSSPRGNALPAPVQDFLLDIQPGYDQDPVRGVYNHGWMVGDERGAVRRRPGAHRRAARDPARRRRRRLVDCRAWPKPSSPRACAPSTASPWTTCASSWARRRRTSRSSCATGSAS